MVCKQCKELDNLQRLSNRIISLTDEEIENLNCLILGNELQIIKEVARL